MASKISGVGVHTIRAWEKRYKALEPVRDVSGHRTYTKLDIEKLMLLSELCLIGYTISKVAKLSVEELKELLKNLGKTSDELESSDFNLIHEKPKINLQETMSILIFALRNFKLDVISQELNKIKMQVSAKEMIFDLLIPLNDELSLLREKGVVSFNQESVFNALMLFHLGHHLYRSGEKRDRSNNIIVAGIEGNFIEYPLYAAGLLCSHYGLSSTFFNRSISTEALCDSLNYLEASILILNIHQNTKEHSLSQSQVLSSLEKIIDKSSPALEIAILGNIPFFSDKLSNKRIHFLNSIISLDQFLVTKAL